MEASPRRLDEIRTPGLGWGFIAGAATSVLLALILSRVQMPSAELSAEILVTSLLFWCVLVPIHVFIGSLFGGLAGCACCAASARHTRIAAVVGGVVAALLINLWLQTMY
jgi:hypothetical protein